MSEFYNGLPHGKGLRLLYIPVALWREKWLSLKYTWNCAVLLYYILSISCMLFENFLLMD